MIDPYQISRLAEDMTYVFGGPWWRFWRRRRTKTEALTAIQAALTGDVEPIRAFGVTIESFPPKTSAGIWVQILRQTRGFRRR